MWSGVETSRAGAGARAGVGRATLHFRSAVAQARAVRGRLRNPCKFCEGYAQAREARAIFASRQRERAGQAVRPGGDDLGSRRRLENNPMGDLDGADVGGGTVGPGGVVGALCNSRRRTWAPTLHKAVSEGTTADRDVYRRICGHGEPPDGVGTALRRGGSTAATGRRRRGWGGI